jgi:hypothetical protein
MVNLVLRGVGRRRSGLAQVQTFRYPNQITVVVENLTNLRPEKNYGQSKMLATSFSRIHSNFR